MTQTVVEHRRMIDGGASGWTWPADILVAGLPAPLLRWTVSLLAAAAAASDIPAVPVLINETRWMPSEPEAARRLFVGDILDEGWADILRHGDIPAILVIDGLAAMWSDISQAGNNNVTIARNIIEVANGFGYLAGQRNILIVRGEDFGDPAGTVARIFAHAGLPPGLCREVLRTLPGPLPRVGEPNPPLPGAAQSFIDGAVIPALHYGCTGERLPVTWPRECLFWGDRLGEAVPRVLEMTGPARAVAYGPYFVLPAGRWTVRATLAFSPGSCGAPLALELHGLTERGRFAFSADRPGLFAASFPVVVPSSREKLEIRLVMERAAIHGTIGIDRIEFIPDQSVA